MTMHEHDQEIIMALAEGSLDPDSVSRATAEIAGCADCSRELEFQRIALDALGNAPAVYLTAAESAALHDRLHHDLRVIPPSPRPVQSSFAWGRWAGLALGTAAVFVVAFLVLPNLFVGGSDDSAETVAFDEFSEEMADGAGNRTATTAAAAVPSAEAPQVAADDLGGAAEMATSETTTTAAAETTAAPETTAVAEPTEAPSGDAYDLEYTIEGSLTEELRTEIIDQLTADTDFFRTDDEAAKSLNPQWVACFDSLVALGTIPDDATPQIVGTLSDEAGRERLLAAFVMPDPAATTLAAITVPECEIFEALP